jgi:hypothetical protein
VKIVVDKKTLEDVAQMLIKYGSVTDSLSNLKSCGEGLQEILESALDFNSVLLTDFLEVQGMKQAMLEILDMLVFYNNTPTIIAAKADGLRETLMKENRE